MKKMCKRALALLFVLSLLMTLTVSALAEEPTEDPGEPQESETTAPEEPKEGEEEPPAEQPAEEPVPELLGEVTLYVSKDGNDESGDGSEQAPFQSLARAAKAANETPDRPVYILVMTDLEMKESARFIGQNISILAADKTVTLKRAEDFKTAKDLKGKDYNPAMIELRAPEGSERKAGSLLLMNVILDDAGRHEGSLFEQPQETEPETESEEPAAQTASAEEPADKEEKKPEQVQDAIVSVGDEGSLTLGRGAELRNFGGLSAVHLGEKSQLTMEESSAIRDTENVANERPALLTAESSVVELLEGAKLLERALQPADETTDLGDLLPGAGELSFSSLTFTAPETLTRVEAEAILVRYEIPYTLSFTMSETVQKLVESQKDNIHEAAGLITIQLDSRMVGDVILFQTEPKLESAVFELDGDVAYEESSHRILAKFKLKEGWQEQLSTLGDPMTFTCKGYLPIERFEASTETEDKYLSSTGKVSLTLRYTLADEEKITTLESSEKTANTKMLGLELSTLVYDVNGGDLDSGPSIEMLPAQKSYRLKTEPKPTHAPVDGYDVIFMGWTASPTERIYASGDEKPALIETVAIPTLGRVTVYAAYSEDINGDGIPDVDQKLATLTFDGNAPEVENVPEPIIHVVGSTEGGELGVNIPQQEPERMYYTFLGWGKTPDATDDGNLYKFDAEKASRRDIPITRDTTLYAVWQLNYRINYDANGGENAPAASVVPYQTKITDDKGNTTYTGRVRITTGVPTREGYTFQGWATSRRGAAAYFAGNEVQITGGNVTLYAAWLRTGGGGGTVAPKTGDTNMGLYIGLLSLSALALAGTGVVLWRKKARQ
ncbi:MAG: InlB B-repeat-containing protein [Oscillospiraceae bacterium]|nr:InlB B-repeat-containing protein [Oscillospiraceae bacterium]